LTRNQTATKKLLGLFEKQYKSHSFLQQGVVPKLLLFFNDKPIQHMMAEPLQLQWDASLAEAAGLVAERNLPSAFVDDASAEDM
jgi:hypothetical protein